MEISIIKKVNESVKQFSNGLTFRNKFSVNRKTGYGYITLFVPVSEKDIPGIGDSVCAFLRKEGCRIHGQHLFNIGDGKFSLFTEFYAK